MRINTEQVIDMLPHAVDLYEKIGLEEYLLRNKKIAPAGESKEKLEERQDKEGHKIIKYILRNATKTKSEIFSIIGIAKECTADKIRTQPFMKTYHQLKDILQTEDILNFFKSAME